MKRRIVVLISGSGRNLQALMDAQLPADIAAVISNRADAFGLTRAKQAGIPTAVIQHGDFPDRDQFDTALAQAIDQYQPDLVVLAGFMRILTEGFVQRYCGRMLNIHPSLLPKYRGLHTHRRALEAGDTEHGSSVHFVTPELDGGPVVLQAVVPIHQQDDETALEARVVEQELVIYPLVVRWFVEQRLKLTDGKITKDGQIIETAIRYEDSLA